MKKARTDQELSLAAEEFEWSASGLTEAHRYILPVLRQWLEEAGARRLLDLGCGNGALARELAHQGFEVMGVDRSRSGLEVARRDGDSIRFEQMEMGRPLDMALRGQFDTVISVEVIEHLLLPRQLFERAREALKPQGHLIITTPYHGYLKNLALALANRFDTHWHPLRDYGHVKFFSRKTVGALFEEQGFCITRFKRAGRIPPLACSMIIAGTLIR